MSLPSTELKAIEIAHLEERIHDLEYEVKDAEWVLRESTCDAKSRQQAANAMKAAQQNILTFTAKLNALKNGGRA